MSLLWRVTKEYVHTEEIRAETREEALAIAGEREISGADLLENCVGETAVVVKEEGVLGGPALTDGAYVFELGTVNPQRLRLTSGDLRQYAEAVLIAENEFYATARLPWALKPGSSVVVLGRGFLESKVAESVLDCVQREYGVWWLPWPLCGFQVGLSAWERDLTLVPNALAGRDDKLLADMAAMERQVGLSHPSTHPTVDDARLIGDRRRQTQVVVLSVAGNGRRELVTWGREPGDKAEAAALGEVIWRALGVSPELTQVREDYRREGESAQRVDDLQRQLRGEQAANAVLRDELIAIKRKLRELIDG